MKKRTRKRYRLVSRTRFTVTLTLFLLIIVLTSTTIISLAKENSGPQPMYHQVQVMAGDTLWEIAREYGPDACDIRRTIYEICEVNAVTPETLRPGQILKIPVK